MILVECKQRSAEWYAARLGKPTASSFNRFMTPLGKLSSSQTAQTYAAELLAERLTGKPADHFVTAAMERGITYEPEARNWYELATGYSVEQVGFALENGKRCGCSPDGIVSENGKAIRGLEIKVPQLQTHIGYCLRGVMPEDYLLQVQGAMWITGLPEWDFLSYAPEAGVPKFSLAVVAHPQLHELIAEGVAKFCGQLDAAEERLRNMAGGNVQFPKQWYDQ